MTTYPTRVERAEQAIAEHRALIASEQKLREALTRIIEIAYAGHPDGRETRLELITRIATKATEEQHDH